MNSISQVESGTSLKQDLEDAINSYLTNPNNPAPVIRDVRNKYILGSELLKMRKNLEKPTVWNLLSPVFKKQWIKQINVINYLTNANGNDSKDLLISFATIPYQEQNELPFIKIDIEDSYDLDFSYNNIGNSFDSITQTFNTSCFTNRVTIRQNIYGISNNSSNFIKPHLINSKFENFINLNLANISNSNFWLDKEFIKNINIVKKYLHITSTNAPNVTFLPIVASNAPTSNVSTGNGNNIGKVILYPYFNFNGNKNYLIGIVYDGFTNLDASTILVSQLLLNNAINEKTGLLINNAKMSRFNDNELQHYLTFINTKNNYHIDLTKILNSYYVVNSSFTSSLSSIVPIGNEKVALESKEVTIQLLIGFFAICSIILSFMIMTLITNIFIRDNWILINILKVLGYNTMEVSYNFIIIIIPIILIFSIFSIFITPLLINMLAEQLLTFSNILYPIIFHWWYFLLTFGINIFIYIGAYAITWFLNFRKYKLWSFME